MNGCQSGSHFTVRKVSASSGSRDHMPGLNLLGPVVQSIVSLTSSLSGQLLKCFMTL